MNMEYLLGLSLGCPKFPQELELWAKPCVIQPVSNHRVDNVMGPPAIFHTQSIGFCCWHTLYCGSLPNFSQDGSDDSKLKSWRHAMWRAAVLDD